MAGDKIIQKIEEEAKQDAAAIAAAAQEKATKEADRILAKAKEEAADVTNQEGPTGSQGKPLKVRR